MIPAAVFPTILLFVTMIADADAQANPRPVAGQHDVRKRCCCKEYWCTPRSSIPTSAPEMVTPLSEASEPATRRASKPKPTSRDSQNRGAGASDVDGSRARACREIEGPSGGHGAGNGEDDVVFGKWVWAGRGVRQSCTLTFGSTKRAGPRPVVANAVPRVGIGGIGGTVHGEGGSGGRTLEERGGEQRRTEKESAGETDRDTVVHSTCRVEGTRAPCNRPSYAGHERPPFVRGRWPAEGERLRNRTGRGALSVVQTECAAACSTDLLTGASPS